MLHSIWSLLSMATNVFPHVRFLCFQCHSATGKAIPTWLAAPGPALLRSSVRQSKFEPLVNEVELIEANPHMPTSGSQMDRKIQYQSVVWFLLLVSKISYKSHTSQELDALLLNILQGVELELGLSLPQEEEWVQPRLPQPLCDSTKA